MDESRLQNLLESSFNATPLRCSISVHKIMRHKDKNKQYWYKWTLSLQQSHITSPPFWNWLHKSSYSRCYCEQWFRNSLGWERSNTRGACLTICYKMLCHLRFTQTHTSILPHLIKSLINKALHFSCAPFGPVENHWQLSLTRWAPSCLCLHSVIYLSLICTRAPGYGELAD